MKKCPFCKAQIEDNAVFCLYCMSSLEEKKNVPVISKGKRRLPVILSAAVLLILLLVLGAFLLLRLSCTGSAPDSASATQDETIVSNVVSDTHISDDSLDKDITIYDPESSLIGSADSQADFNAHNNPEVTEGATVNPQQENKVPQADTSQNSSQTPAITTKPQENIQQDSPQTEEKPSASNVSYTYRQAQRGDDFSANYPFSSDEIVITGVNGTSSNGGYVIPSQIDGKTVIAIMPLSFSGSSVSGTVKSVIVPSTVKTIWGNAFYNCTNLTDIYFCGKSIYTETTAFVDPSQRSGTLTIHCAYDCSDRNLRYYRNSASYYGAVYKNWNGGV